MVGGTTPPQSDSGEISRVLVLNLLWQSKRCSRTAEEIFVLDNAFALIEGHPRVLWWTHNACRRPGHPAGAPRCAVVDSQRMPEAGPPSPATRPELPVE